MVTEANELPGEDDAATVIEETRPLRASFHDELSSSETDPLLPLSIPVRNDQTPLRLSARVIILIATLIITIALLGGIIVRSSLAFLEDAQQRVDVNLESISIENVTQKTISARLSGEILFDMDLMVNSAWKRNFIKSIAASLGILVVIPDPGLRLYALPIESKNSPIFIAELDVPPIQLDFTSQNLLPFDTVVQVVPKVDEIVRLYEELGLSCFIRGVTLDFILVGLGSVKSRFMKFSANRLSLRRRQWIQLKKYVPEYTVESFELSSKHDAIYINTELKLIGRIPTSMELSASEWELMMRDCTDEWVKFGSWSSEGIRLIPATPVEVTISGKVTEIPPQLDAICNYGRSPFNQLVQNYTEQKAVEVAVRRARTDTSLNDTGHHETWIDRLLHDCILQLSLVLPHPKIDAKLSAMDLLEAKVLDEPWHFMVQSLAIGVGTISSIKGFSESKVSFKGDIMISNSHSELLSKITLKSYSDFTIGLTSDIDAFSLAVRDSLLEVVSPSILGSILNDLLNGVKIMDQFNIKVFLSKVAVQTPAFRFDLFDLSLPLFPIDLLRDYEPLVTSAAKQNWLTPDDCIVDVSRIQYESSTSDTIMFTCDARIANLTSLAFEMTGQQVYADLIIAGEKIGRAYATNVCAYSGKPVTALVHFGLSGNTVNSKISLEQWLSRYLSMLMRIRIDSIQPGAPENEVMSKFLSEVSVRNFTVPPVRYHDTVVESGDKQDKKQHPFVVRSVIHIFSSEVEVTFYNPILNREVVAVVYQAEAHHDNIVLGRLAHHETVSVPPGRSQSRRMPITIDKGIGTDLLRRALNGDLAVSVSAVFLVNIGQFAADLMVRDVQVTCDIRV